MTLCHILAGEWKWLCRWRGDAPAEDLSPAAFPNAEALESGWDALNQEMAVFVAGLSDELLAVPQEVRGERYALAELMLARGKPLHVSQGQVASLLRQLGHVPPATDFGRFLSEARQLGLPNMRLKLSVRLAALARVRFGPYRLWPGPARPKRRPAA